MAHDVVVKNTAAVSVHFTKVQPTCSCAAGTTLEKTDLAPGEQTTLHFVLGLRHRTGPQRFACRLFDAAGGEWVYELETTIYERARFSGAGAIYFGMVDPVTEHDRGAELCLYERKGDRFPDVSFTTDTQGVRVEQGAMTTDEQEDGFVAARIPIKVHLRTPAVSGTGQGVVRARLSYGAEPRDVMLAATWNVRTLLSVSPAQVYFGSVTPASPTVSRKVELRRTDGQPLLVEGVQACPGVTCLVGPVTTSAVRLTLTLDPKAAKTPLVGAVVVKTNHPQQPTIKVPVAALPKQAG